MCKYIICHTLILEREREIHVCMYIYIYIYIFLFAFINVDLCVYVYMYIYVYLYIHTHPKRLHAALGFLEASSEPIPGLAGFRTASAGLSDRIVPRTSSHAFPNYT